MKIAICDNEHVIRENIFDMVKKQHNGCDIDLYDSGDALLKSPCKYDIYFLDIQMPGTDGMETAQRLRKELAEESVIIFITAFTDYMPDAFDVRAFHYLMKPVDETKFNNVFTRAIKEHQRLNNNKDRHLLAKSGDVYHKLPIRDIFYIETQGRKVVIYSKSGTVEYYEKAKVLEQTLGVSFFRCHRCYIVNMEYITRYNANTIWLKNGAEIFVAQKKYADFVKAYLGFCTGNISG